jgi:hypothetical protein
VQGSTEIIPQSTGIWSLTTFSLNWLHESEKLICRLASKLSVFYGTQTYITTFTSIFLGLIPTQLNPSTSLQPFIGTCILIISYHLRLDFRSRALYLGCPPKFIYIYIYIYICILYKNCDDTVGLGIFQIFEDSIDFVLSVGSLCTGDGGTRFLPNVDTHVLNCATSGPRRSYYWYSNKRG